MGPMSKGERNPFCYLQLSLQPFLWKSHKSREVILWRLRQYTGKNPLV